MEHRYILKDWDVENRFQKFWEWHNTILEYDMRIYDTQLDTMVKFRKFLYMEESIAEVGIPEMTDFLDTIEYHYGTYFSLSKREQNQMWYRYGRKIKQRFIDTRQFTKEPEDSESDNEDSPESYELEGESDEYEIRTEDDNTWSILELKDKIEEMGGKFSDKDIQKIWDLRKRMELILTDEFLGTVWEVINLNTNQCKNCKRKELLELKDDLEKLGYELDISEIRRIKELRISDSDKLYEWVNENTTFCNECGIRWINNKFDEGKTKCKDCENEINVRVKRLKQTCDEVKMEITEGELELHQ
ncbi:hypothetical protein RhiirA4_485291 [Rhizophagus irregularis]|uniref:Uncharacterized protein n=1 Tax=Rhizophagus irregularis TaxID=588596 RepID=A0A2I1HQ18_9GLOM|nr:hypothetical protein RhiirA4_485291 [Rhizophagus irregularis]